VRLSYELKLKVYVAYVSGHIDNEEFARALVSLNPTTTSSDSRASSDSPLGGQEDEPELPRVSESHAPVKGSNKDDDGNIGLVSCSGRLSASTAATEAETIATNVPCFAAQRLPESISSKIDRAAGGGLVRGTKSVNDMIVTLQNFLRKAARTGGSRMQQDDVRIQSLLACFERLRDASPPSLLVSATYGGTMVAPHAASSARSNVHGGSISDAAVATPDLDRLCLAFQKLLSYSSRWTRQQDDMFPYYARRIQEILLVYPHVSTGGTCYRFLVQTNDLQSVLMDSGFDTRQTLHEMTIDLPALGVSANSSSADAGFVAWKEVLMFLGPTSTISCGAHVVWLTKNVFLLAAGSFSPLDFFGDRVLGCFGFCMHFEFNLTRRNVRFRWIGYAREPVDPEEIERVTDAIGRHLYLDPANDHFCLERDRNATLVPCNYMGTLSLVRQRQSNKAAQDPVGGVLACMYEGDRKFHGMMKTFCSCLIPALGMNLGPPKLFLAADAEEQCDVEFSQFLDALSRSKVVEAIAVLFPRGRQNGGLNRAWIDALADALAHLDRLEEIHIDCE
jgi:hypothetical protein